MNIILFEPDETLSRLPRSDPRAVHILEVLRRRPGDPFDAGLIDGPRGTATLLDISSEGLSLSFEWREEPPPLLPITLIVGLPRPQTARRVLQEMTSLGVGAMHFVSTERGEPGYARSPLWTAGEWRRHLIAGAQQAFDTRLPVVTHGLSLAHVIDSLSGSSTRLCLDNYEASRPLTSASLNEPVVLAIGSERGWSDGERKLLREAGFELVHLGPRVLRTDTACIAAVSLIKAGLSA